MTEDSGPRPRSADGSEEMIAAWEGGELVPVGKLEAHRRGLRHPAISVILMDGERTLLQRRAAGKYHTPGLWANACCTHPLWGEPPRDCALRRLREEIGVTGLDLVPLGRIEYRADVGGGLIEHELVDLFGARADSAALRTAPNPEEVSELRWIALDALAEEIAETPERFTPWLRIYMREIVDRLAALDR